MLVIVLGIMWFKIWCKGCILRNELSLSMKYWEFFDYLTDHYLLKKGRGA
jgi:hypothetical protein